jgi:hypothetical protein
MSNEITATKPPVIAVVLAVLIALAGLVLTGMLVGPFVADLFATVWTFTLNTTAWTFNHTVVPAWSLVTYLAG